MRCLVVDDDRDGATVLGDLLELLGAEVRVVYDGAEAIAIAPEFQPQMVVLDINMPRIDGFVTSSALHQQAWSNAAKFIAYTGLPHPKSALTAAGSGTRTTSRSCDRWPGLRHGRGQEVESSFGSAVPRC